MEFDAWDRLVEVKNSGGITLAASETHVATTTDHCYSAPRTLNESSSLHMTFQRGIVAPRELSYRFEFRW